MDAFLTSTISVALAEVGDKTQLLSLLLAARFRRPWPILAGIIAATLANHALAAWLGSAVASYFDGRWFDLLIASSFIAIGLWTLRPDTLQDEESQPRFGAFVTTVLWFFVAEMGDKTQLATIALGARFDDVIAVTVGTTLGMIAANAPAVFIGPQLVQRIPLSLFRLAAALTFLAVGGWMLVTLF